MPSPPGPLVAILLFACAAETLGLPPPVPAQPRPIAEDPDAFLEAPRLPPTDPGQLGDEGTEAAIDATAAEASAVEPDGAAPNLSPAETRRVEEITVSARRRTEFLEDTPVAVTALSSELLRATNTTRLSDIARLVPSLNITTVGGSSSAISIRGIGSFPNGYFDQGVGVYFDGVYLPRSQANAFDVIDIQQIEVLRGPQGTLFGKNSAGGAIRVETVKPHEEIEGSAYLRAGTQGQVFAKTMLNLPLVEERLFGRFNVAYQTRRGFAYDELSDEYYDDLNSITGFGALRWQALDDLVFDASGFYSRMHDHGLLGECQYIQPSQYEQVIGWTSAGNPPPLPNPAAEAYVDACRKTGPRSARLNTPQVNSAESSMFWATGLWDVGEAGWLENLTLKALTSWRHQETYSRVDVDGTEYDLFAASSTGGVYGGSPQTGTSLTEELIVNAAAFDGRLNFVTGGFLFWEKYREDGMVFFLPGTVSDLGGGTTRNEFSTDNWDWAIYGQADYALTDFLQVVGGVRYTEEKKGVDRLITSQICDDPSVPFTRGSPVQAGCYYPGPEACQPGTGPGTGIDCVPMPGPFNREPVSGECAPGTGPGTDRLCEPVPTSQRAVFTNWSPMASLKFTAPPDWLGSAPIDHWMTYFTYAQGFKGGGFNGGARDNSLQNRQAFLPETVDSYEIGIKTLSFDNRLTLNLTGYIADYDDIQIPTVETILPPPECVPPADSGLDECLPGVITLVRNIPTSRIRGIELELYAHPLDGLLIDSVFSYTDARIGHYDQAENPLTGEPDDVSGERFAFIPPLKSHLGIQYSVPLVVGPRWLDGWLTPRVDWDYTDAIQRFSERLNEGATPNAALAPAYNVVNVRVSYAFNDNRSQIAFWGTNVTGTDYVNLLNPFGQRVLGTIIRYYGPPRSWGIELSHVF